MRIAMIGAKGVPATWGGVERHVEELAARLVERGHEVTVYCRRHYTPRDLAAHRGIRLVVLPSLATQRLDAISHTALAAVHAFRRGYDVIHFHAIGPSLLSFAPRLPGFGSCAVVATVHALDYRRRKWGVVARWWLRRGEAASVRFPHRTIVVSETLREHFVRRGRSVARIPNGVPAPDYAPLEDLKPLGIEPGRFILWLGRFVPEKRVEDLIAAFRRLEGDWPLVLGGEADPSDGCVKALRAAAEGEARIIWAGGLYGRRKSEALSHAGLVVLPSEVEGFPIVLLEAMRYGRPVLASDIPEHREIIQDGRNGFLFPVGRPDALAERMRWMIAHPSETASAARQGAHDATAFDWDVIAEQTEAVYREAVAEARGRIGTDA